MFLNTNRIPFDSLTTNIVDLAEEVSIREDA